MGNPFKMILLQQSVLPGVILSVLHGIDNKIGKKNKKFELPPASNLEETVILEIIRKPLLIVKKIGQNVYPSFIMEYLGKHFNWEHGLKSIVGLGNLAPQIYHKLLRVSTRLDTFLHSLTMRKIFRLKVFLYTTLKFLKQRL